MDGRSGSGLNGGSYLFGGDVVGVNVMCKLIGHKWEERWMGAMSGYFGAVVVNVKTCARCDEAEYEYSTKLELRKRET